MKIEALKMEVAVTGQRKTYTFLKRAKGTKRGAFLQQWAHAVPIAEDSPVARRTLNAVSYIGFVGLLFPFDGIEEAWAISKASGHPAPTRYAHLAVHEKRSLTFNAIENVIIKGTARCKRVIATRRIKGISKYDYSRYWMSRHVEVIVKQTKFVSYLRGYVQNHAIPDTIRYLNGEAVPDHLQFDGVIAQSFDSLSDAIRAYTTWGYLRNIGADEPNFIDSPHCPFTAVKERVMFADSSRPGR